MDLVKSQNFCISVEDIMTGNFVCDELVKEVLTGHVVCVVASFVRLLVKALKKMVFSLNFQEIC